MRYVLFRISRRGLASLFAIAILLCLLTPSISTSASPGVRPAGTDYSSVFNKLSDPGAGADSGGFLPSTLQNGRLWTDKTVSADKAVIYDLAGKPVNGIVAKADEFLITLSALSQSYNIDAIVEPTDTVFILDVSASMYINKLDNGKSRVEAMIDSLNDAIGTLMDQNPANRIAVVAFGGDSGSSRICPILKLDHHVVDDGKYFSMRSAAYIQVSSQIPDSALFDPSNRAVRVYGGTPTQHGVYAGARILLDNDDTAFTYADNGRELTVTRKPNIVLLSDGGATLGWTDYKFQNPLSDTESGFDCGDANTTDIGVSVLTVLTAAYFKQQVKDHYYGTDESANSAGFYTIGLSIAGTGFDAPAVLDPAGNAEKVSRVYSKNTYNMKTILDDFTNLAGGSDISFPALNKGSSSTRGLVNVRNDGNFIKSYDYTDGYYSAEKAEDLSEAFRSIARRIVSTGNYSTRVDTGDANFDGYLIFSDVLGDYMEFKGAEGLWFDNSVYDGHLFAQSMTNGDSAYRAMFVNAMIQHQGYFDTDEVTAKSIAESLLDSCIAAGKSGGGLFYNNGADFSNRIKYYADFERSWVGNYFNADGSVAAVPAAAGCVVDLYTTEGTVKDPVSGDDADLIEIAIHVVTALEDGEFECAYSDGNELIRHLKKGQQVVRWYIPASLIPARTVSVKYNDAGTAVDSVHIKETLPIHFIYSVGLRDGLVLADMDNGYKTANLVNNKSAYHFYTNSWDDPRNLSMAFFRPGGTNPYYYDTENNNATIAKADNPTGTVSYVFSESSITIGGDRIQVQLLGNNGRLTVPFTEIYVANLWDPTLEWLSLVKPEYVQLYQNGLPVGTPVLMTYFDEDEYTWKELPSYQLQPVADGKAGFIEYTIAEGDWDGSTFTPYDPDSHPAPGFAVFYRQPEWYESLGFWEDAYIVNYQIADIWYLTLEKKIDGDNPFLENASAQTIFEISDGGATPMIRRYPDNFINGKCYIQIQSAGNYTVREIDSGVMLGCNCELSIATDFPAANTSYTAEGDGIILNGVPAGRTVTVTFTNTFEDLNVAVLTLNKTFSGDATGAYPDDLAFEVVGVDSVGSEIYRNTVYFADFDPAHGLTLARLKPGSYTINELGGEAPGYDRTLSAKVDGVSAGTLSDNMLTIPLSSGEHRLVDLDSEFGKHGNLTIQKTIAGLDVSKRPADIVFHVVGRDSANDLICERYIDYSEFDVSGKYVFADINPGTYTISETGGGISGYKMTTIPESCEITVVMGHLDETVAFINTYDLIGDLIEDPGNGDDTSESGDVRNDDGNGAGETGDMRNDDITRAVPSVFVDKHIWYIRGYKDNTLRPEGPITRAEIAMALSRLLVPELREIDPSARFIDVDSGEWYSLAVNLLAFHGIFSGYPDGLFKPNQPITRSELAAVVSRFERLAETGSNPYNDLDPDNWAYKHILSATKKGWFTGDGNGSFRPNDNVKRAEFVTVANRVLNRQILTEDIPDGLHGWSDLEIAHWSYAAFTEAIHSHDFKRKPDGTNEEWIQITGDGTNAPYNY
ncbi:MAG: S-layer homology domain-containing protein [Oscillospiraceae bacterium]|jgi:hypothetical protein|nr:S-layer homology domain-containing protein [Oscillospiraceae bacterium]